MGFYDTPRDACAVALTGNHACVAQEAASRAVIPYNVEVVSQFDQALRTVEADPSQLGQAFGNNIINAVQAMPDGGRLMVRSEVISPGWVGISFSDTGAGMPPDSLGKIFEPLFTTKARPVGLGLAITRMMVERHGDTVGVDSEVGKGSTFTVKLPIRSEAAGPAPGQQAYVA